MREISLDEMKQIQIDMLEQMAAYCEANQLRYFLTGGTLIGAIRHKGYIPWDDDIDIAMPREDYEKFVANFDMNEYKVITPYNTPKYLYPFAKIINSNTRITEHTDMNMSLGIYIDIFPIDCIPQHSISTYYRKRKWYEFIITCQMAEKEKKRSYVKDIIIAVFRKLFKTVNLNAVAQKIDLMSKKYTHASSNMAGNLVWGYGAREIVDKSIFDEYILHSFQGKEFRIPRRYHDYLFSIYGDYMQLPPEEKRVLKHDVKAFWM